MTLESKQHDLTVTRVFDAPVAAVWAAWSESEQMKQWWGPAGFTCPVAKMDFREGGVSLTCMRAPAEFGGQDFYNTWAYQKIVPMQVIEYLMGFSDQDGHPIDPTTLGLPPGMPAEVPQTVTFKAISDHQTEITMTEYGYPSQEIVEMSKMGLEQCLDKMAALLVTV
ncbi:MAG: ATPase [Chloroflexota bacterium]|nr:MAG: ATPase [Chloroflexota bacterium]